MYLLHCFKNLKAIKTKPKKNQQKNLRNCTYSPAIIFCFSAINAATYSFIFCKEESQVGKEVSPQKPVLYTVNNP